MSDERLKNIEDMLDKIFKILNGNGSKGLVTKVALQEQQMKSLPSPNTLKFYAMIGGGVVTFLGWLGYVIVKTFSINNGGS